MLGKRVCLRANESISTYTFELQLQKPHIISHRAVIVDRMTADGEVRLRESEDARMRAKVMTWNPCAAVRVESGWTLESLVWDETHVTPSTKRCPS
jgi:hypothetical protein